MAAPQQLESDKDQIDANFVTFFRKAVQNNFKSGQAGHPVFEDIDYVRITSPAPQGAPMPLNVIETPVSVAHKQRYPRLWANYQAAMAGHASQEGAPVENWPALSPAQAFTLKAMGLHTVEQIAATSDAQAQGLIAIGPGIRDKAIAYLRALRSDAVAEAEADARNKAEAEKAALEARLADQARQMEAMQAQIAALVSQTRAAPRRGRPRKGQAEVS